MFAQCQLADGRQYDYASQVGILALFNVGNQRLCGSENLFVFSQLLVRSRHVVPCQRTGSVVVGDLHCLLKFGQGFAKIGGVLSIRCNASQEQLCLAFVTVVRKLFVKFVKQSLSFAVVFRLHRGICCEEQTIVGERAV